MVAGGPDIIVFSDIVIRPKFTVCSPVLSLLARSLRLDTHRESTDSTSRIDGRPIRSVAAIRGRGEQFAIRCRLLAHLIENLIKRASGMNYYTYVIRAERLA